VSRVRAVGLAATVRTGRHLLRALGTIACAVALVLVLPAAAAVAHKGNPNYKSDLDGLTRQIQGVKVEVLNYDDRLLLTNDSGKDVVIRGYDGEPYARLLADGTVQENRLSPAFYLNGDRFGQVTVPPQANPKARPQWKTDNKTGRFEWHDHRIHWMSKTTPGKVKDKDVRTKIFDWRVPIRVGAQPVAITGSLYWQPTDSSAPVGAFIALGVFCAALVALVVTVRVRRRSGADRKVREKAQAW
jgi:hypothetical protein